MKIIALNPSARYQNGKEKFDYLSETILEGMYKCGIDVIATDASNGVTKTYSDEEVIRHSKDADYIFLFWGKNRGGRGEPRYYLLDQIQRPESTVYIDGSEWTYTGYPSSPEQCDQAKTDSSFRRGEPWLNEEALKYCGWYFKRECYQQDADRGVYPLLFGAVDRQFYKGETERAYDIFCSYGQIDDGLRESTLNFCESLKKEGYNIMTDSSISYDEYIKALASSYIAVDAWGGGDNCARIWEIFANKACCVAQKYNIMFPDPFRDNHSFVEYESIGEFEAKVRNLLVNKDKCLEIGQRGYDHMTSYHSAESRVQYIMKILEETKSEKLK